MIGLFWLSDEVTSIVEICDSSFDVDELRASSPDTIEGSLSERTEAVVLEVMDGPTGVFVERARECVLLFSAEND